jgi:hypothetical protein
MRSNLRFVALAIASTVVGIPRLEAQRRDEVTGPRSARVSAAGARGARIEARAGSLRIEGRSGITEIQARGTARASSRSLLDEIRLTAERRGDYAYVIVDVPEIHGNWGGDDQFAALDLIVEVPNTLALDVEDRSGELEIRNVGALDLVDASGDATIENVGGRLRVRDNSGELRIRDVRGDVELEDGSGGIHLRTIRGSVNVDRDGSGEFDAEDVTGSLRIRSKGSGSVDVVRVGGDFVVERKSSGSITHRDVRGRVEIPERGRRRRSSF